MAAHTLAPSPETVHWGHFDASLTPRLTVRSGDTVTIETVSGTPEQVPDSARLRPGHAEIHQAVRPEVGPHLLTGPVAVEGAEPGDMLEVRVREVSLTTDWGYMLILPLKGTLPDEFDTYHHTLVELDHAENLARLPFGVSVPLAPFFGVMAVAPPPHWGRVTSVEPRAFGGNLDCTALGAGATLYLPVFAPGALFSVGDGHAVQADGEVCVTAVETCLTGTFELILHKGVGATWLRAETPTHHVTFGLNEDLDDAAAQAVREMIDLVVERRGLSRVDAYLLCSLAADLRVTQIVDGQKGIHAMMAKSILA